MLKKSKNQSFKETHKNVNQVWRKQVLQNKIVSFRPTDKQWKLFKELGFNKSGYIKKSIDLRMQLIEDPEKFFIYWGRKMPEQFKRANRKLGRERKERRIIYGK